MIPHNTILQITQATQIEDIIAKYMPLKKKGSNLVGSCPFHNEKTPSMMVSPVKNIFKCFGCGKGGDAVTFVMEHEKVNYPQAVTIIGEHYNITIPTDAPVDPEAQKQAQLRESLISFNLFALSYYTSQLTPAITEYLTGRGINPESIATWQIGYAPKEYASLATHARSAGYKEEFLLQTGLVRQSERDHSLYDFFSNRIIFPIFDEAGRLVSFAGRVLPGAPPNSPKYINLAETTLYDKSKLLFGLRQASRSIRQAGSAIIVEGYTDVIQLQQIDINHVVATSGTAFTDGMMRLIKRYTNCITILSDGDSTGAKAAIKNAITATKSGINVYIAILPWYTPIEQSKPPKFEIKTKKINLKVDPASFFTTTDIADSFFHNNVLPFITFYSDRLLKMSGHDPFLKNDAINQIGELLAACDETTRELYITAISKNHRIKTKLLQDKVKEITATIPGNGKLDEDDVVLPKGVDPIQFQKYGFYEYKNCYYFQTNKGHEKLSNFIMVPIFHINSINESKRIYELENERNFKVVVDLDMQEMTSIQAFQRNVEGRGNFLFWGMASHFSRLKLMLYEQTRTCNEIRVLGWQKEGFWAWANGITTPEGFTPTDEYGVVEYNNENYFIPAYSKIYISDKSVFTDERRFKYIPNNTTLTQWVNQFQTVFGDNALIGIAFWVATAFRDHILRIFKNFPILNLFGPKGTGKSQMAVSLCYLFGDKQVPYNIHNGTKPGLAEHLQQFSNALSWVDEYKNNIEYDKIETLKAIFDSIGRSRLSIDKGKKKETTSVNSGVILSGQEMPTADVALFSRLVFLQFNKDTFTDKEKKDYDNLKEMESGGLSHLTATIIQHRKYFEDNFYETYQSTLSEFTGYFSENDVEDRILRSMVSIIAAWRTIAQLITFPFTYDQIKKVALKTIETQNNQVSRSNEMGLFWNIIESLFDDNVIIDKWHFRVDYTDQLSTSTGDRKYASAINILKFKYNVIYSAYAQQARRQGVKPLPQDSLRYYLQNHRAYIGIQPQCVFTETRFDNDEKAITRKSQNTSAMCFNYETLNINLIRTEEPNPDINGTDYRGPVPASPVPYEPSPRSIEDDETYTPF